MPPREADEAPQPPASTDEAYAATVAPTTPPIDLPRPGGLSSDARTRKPELESDATVAAPPPSGDHHGTTDTLPPIELPPLPEVSAAHYKMGAEIARGGMGKIVAAEDLRLGRPVALKQLIDPSPDQVSRFQREALITAHLQHPGIVPVYEAGRWPSPRAERGTTIDGRGEAEPFFAMKLVSGRPLDKVIAEARTLEQRLAMLPRIAAATDAIAYAHSQRVIHRDLKPGNILIGEFGETVVIDWGLAKDLDATDAPESRNRAPRVRTKTPTVTQSATLTVAGSVMGTPAYMAPEQARGEPLDERADVFALGAMLYHTLAGVPPYNARTATDVIASAALGKVVPLVEREKRVPADLVAIVERAMAPLPIDRYQNAGELAEELRRFMTGQLVEAHRYSAAQRVARFVKKHRAAVAISAIALAGFAVGGSMAVRRIIEARDRAESSESVAVKRKHSAEALVEYMLHDVKSNLSSIGRLDLLEGLGTEVRHYYDSIASEGFDAADLVRMANAVDLLGVAEQKSGKPELALKTWTDVRAKLAALVGADRTPATFAARRMLAKLDDEIGTIHQARGKLDKATEVYTQAKNELLVLATESALDREVLLNAATVHDHLGDVLRTEGKIDQAFEEYSTSRADREKANALGNGSPREERMAVSTSHMKLGSVYQARGDTQLALEEYRASLKLRESILAGDADNVETQESVLEIQTVLADLQRLVGDDKSAIATYRAAIPVIDALMRRDSTNTGWKRRRGMLCGDLGFALLDSGSFAEGLTELDAAIGIEKELADRDPTNTQYQTELSRTYTRAGDGHVYLGDVDAGIAQYQLALDLRKELKPGTAQRRSLAWSFHKLAHAYVLKGDRARALELHTQALELRAKLADEAPSQGGFKNELAATQIALGKLVVATDPKRGVELIEGGVRRAKELVDGDPINTEWKETYVQGLLARAEAARLAGDAVGRTAALETARDVAEDAAHRSPQNAHWPGFLAEAHAGLAETHPAEWKKVREILEPMAKAGRLSWVRKPLLDQALAHR